MQPKTNLAVGINTPRKDRTELKKSRGKTIYMSNLQSKKCITSKSCFAYCIRSCGIERDILKADLSPSYKGVVRH